MCDLQGAIENEAKDPIGYVDYICWLGDENRHEDLARRLEAYADQKEATCSAD